MKQITKAELEVKTPAEIEDAVSRGIPIEPIVETVMGVVNALIKLFGEGSRGKRIKRLEDAVKTLQQVNDEQQKLIDDLREHNTHSV